MRSYEQDSPEAMARVLTALMISDGEIDPSELEMLERHDAFRRLGMSDVDFMRVMLELCEDMLAQTPEDAPDCVLPKEQLARMLELVEDPRRRRMVLAMMLHVIRADGRVHPGESTLFWNACDQWRMQLADAKAKPARPAGEAANRRVHRVAHASVSRRRHAAGEMLN
jgi:hypothetical protein